MEAERHHCAPSCRCCARPRPLLNPELPSASLGLVCELLQHGGSSTIAGLQKRRGRGGSQAKSWV
eukprot:scaffold168_cov410-Prasinococcus_capsulatus_cf.AAC.2